jgi:hypothetical protein
MLVLPVRVKTQRLEGEESKTKKTVGYNLSSFRAGDPVSSLSVASSSSEAGWGENDMIGLMK